MARRMRRNKAYDFDMMGQYQRLELASDPSTSSDVLSAMAGWLTRGETTLPKKGEMKYMGKAILECHLADVARELMLNPNGNDDVWETILPNCPLDLLKNTSFQIYAWSDPSLGRLAAPLVYGFNASAIRILGVNRNSDAIDSVNKFAQDVGYGSWHAVRLWCKVVRSMPRPISALMAGIILNFSQPPPSDEQRDLLLAHASTDVDKLSGRRRW